MRRALGSVLLLAALSACGSDAGSDRGTGKDDTSPGWSQVALLSESAARGQVAEVATPLPDDGAVREFVAPLEDRLAGEVVVAARAATVPEGQELYGAVVAIGCEVPAGVTVAREGEAVVVEATARKPSPGVQCLVPVTTVALVLVES